MLLAALRTCHQNQRKLSAKSLGYISYIYSDTLFNKCPRNYESALISVSDDLKTSSSRHHFLAIPYKLSLLAQTTHQAQRLDFFLHYGTVVNLQKGASGKFMARAPRLKIVVNILNLKSSDSVDPVLNKWKYKKENQRYPELLRALQEQLEVRRALEAFQWMKRQPCYKPNLVSYEILLHLTARRGVLSLTRNLFDEMVEAKLQPSAECYTALIKALGRDTNWRAAIDVLDEMHQNNVAPSRSCYNAIIFSCGMARQLFQARAMFDMMERQGFAADVSSFNILVGVAAQTGHHNMVLQLMEEMKQRGLQPNIVTNSSFLFSLTRRRRFADVIEAYEELDLLSSRECNFPILACHNEAIGAYGATSRPDRARQVFNHLLAISAPPFNYWYTSMILAYARAGQSTQAQEIFDLLMSKGLEPYRLAYSALKSAYLNANQPNQAARVAEMMKIMMRSSGSDGIPGCIE